MPPCLTTLSLGWRSPKFSQCSARYRTNRAGGSSSYRSGCLLKEPGHKRMVTQRGWSSKQSHRRGRETTISRPFTACTGIFPTTYSAPVGSSPSKDTSLRLPWEVAGFHQHHCAASQYQRCLIDLCRFTMPPCYLSSLPIQVRGKSCRFW